MNRVLIDNIITGILTIDGISDVLGDRVFSETPINEQAGIYMIVSIVGDNVDTIVSKRALIECRIIANVDSVSLNELHEIVGLISDGLVYPGSSSDYGFGVYKVTEESISPPLKDDKGRWEVVKDYLFHFTQ